MPTPVSVIPVIVRQSGGGATSCPDSGQKRFIDLNDGRKNVCIYYESNPDRVETLEHFIWRTSEPTDPNKSKRGAGILMAVMGGIFGIGGSLTLYEYIKRTNAGYNWWIIGMIVVCLLGLITMFVFGVIFCVNSAESSEEKAAREEELAKYKASEPAVKYELI